MKAWEDKLKNWTKPPSTSEEEKCSNAESMIRDAIKGYKDLENIDIDVFGQGSYKNNTNVKLNSDVDICVKSKDHLFIDIPENTSDDDFGIITLDYTYSTFKNSVHKALIEKFGGENVTRGDKSIKIHSNTYRVDADIVPAFEHRRYIKKGSLNHHKGIEFLSDSYQRIINWPEQNYENGVAKNLKTNRRYKKIVRILKKIDYELEANGNSIANKTPSYLVECLVWNVPNSYFKNFDSYYESVEKILLYLYKETKDEENCKEWGEVNELKYLFQGNPNWSNQLANKFITEAWNYLEY